MCVWDVEYYNATSHTHMYMPLYYCVPDRIHVCLVHNSTMVIHVLKCGSVKLYIMGVLLKGAATVYTCITLVPRFFSCE